MTDGMGIDMDLPIANHPIEFLYFWDASYRGLSRGTVKGLIDATLVGGGWYRTKEDLVESFEDAIQRRLTLYYEPMLDRTNGLLYAPEVAAGYWDRIQALYVDEPTGDRAAVERVLAGVTAQHRAMGLAEKPFVMSFTEKHLLNDTGWQASQITRVVLECYIDPARQHDADVVAQLTANVARQMDRVGNHEIILTPMAYNRNGLWTNMDSLRAVQTVGYLAAAHDRRVTGLWPFSLDRGGDMLALPYCIRREHERMRAAALGLPQPEPVACEDDALSRVHWAPGPQ